MKVEIIELKENDDGSCDVNINCDAEFTKEAISHYFSYLITAALEKKDGYDIQSVEEVDIDDDAK